MELKSKIPSEKGKLWETMRRKAKGLNHSSAIVIWMAAGCRRDS